jgi:hypothetical protein
MIMLYCNRLMEHTEDEWAVSRLQDVFIDHSGETGDFWWVSGRSHAFWYVGAGWRGRGMVFCVP